MSKIIPSLSINHHCSVPGEGNLIEEQSEIINKNWSTDLVEAGNNAVPVMIIGNNNVFEVGNNYSNKVLEVNTII